MMNGSLNKSTIITRSGTSFARGVTIDLLLEEDETAQLYANWDNAWGEPLQFQGGATAITCEMVAGVPVQELVSVYGKKLAGRYLAVAQKNALV